MSNGTKVIAIDEVRGHGHKPAPWHGNTGTVLAKGFRPGQVWVQFGNDRFAAACVLCHVTNLKVA
jgi:hypothetical protein